MKLKTTLSVLLAIALTAMSAILVNARGVDPGGVNNVSEAWTAQNGELPDCVVLPSKNQMLNSAPALATVCSREVRAGPVSITQFDRYNQDVDSATADGQVVIRQKEAVLITDYRAGDLFTLTLASARANST